MENMSTHAVSDTIHICATDLPERPEPHRMVVSRFVRRIQKEYPFALGKLLNASDVLQIE